MFILSYSDSLIFTLLYISTCINRFPSTIALALAALLYYYLFSDIVCQRPDSTNLHPLHKLVSWVAHPVNIYLFCPHVQMSNIVLYIGVRF